MTLKVDFINPKLRPFAESHKNGIYVLIICDRFLCSTTGTVNILIL